MAVSTVYFWAKRFKTEGADSLRYRKRGRPTGSGRLLNPAQEEKIQAIIMSDEPKAHGINFSTWTRRAVAELVSKLFGIKIAVRTVGDYLARWEMTPQKPLKYSIKRDETKINDWIHKAFPSIAKLAKSVNAIIFFADESCVQTTDFNQRSFSKKGIKPSIKTLGTRLKANIISAVSNNGMMR
jgi:transposase